jgi:hypothetical protein
MVSVDGTDCFIGVIANGWNGRTRMRDSVGRERIPLQMYTLQYRGESDRWARPVSMGGGAVRCNSPED